jgi:hypothetical protein
MKKFITLLVVVLVGIYGVGRLKLGESGAMSFLAQMESLMNEGKGAEICEMFHEDLEVDIADHTGESTLAVNGGKEEFCDLTVTAAASLNLVPHTSSVNFTDVEAKRDWLHPWTSEVSYVESRSLTVRGANVTMRTESNDAITLVHTFSGVKLLKIKSEIYKADAT